MAGNSDIFRVNPNSLAPYPCNLALSRGLFPDHSLFYMSGRLTAPTADTDYDMWAGAANGFASYPFPTSAVRLEVASTSANDTLAGTGMRTVAITGLDSNYDAVTEVLELSGQTPVLTTNSFIRVNFVRGIQAGSGGVNEGTIWVADAATDWTLGVPDTNAYKLNLIEAGEGQSAVGVFTAPRGYSIYYPSFVASASKGGVNATCDVKVAGRGYNEDSVNNRECWRNYVTMGLSGNADSTESFREDLIMIPSTHKTDVKMVANSNFTTAPIYSRLALLLIKEPQPTPLTVT